MSDSTNPYRPPTTRESEVPKANLQTQSANQSIDYLLMALLTIPGLLVIVGAVLNSILKLQ